MSFTNGIELTNTVELAGANFVSTGAGVFSNALEISENLEVSDGTFVSTGAVIATNAREIFDNIEMSDGYLRVLNSPNTYTKARIIRVYALPKEEGDDAQILSLQDIPALKSFIYPESTGNPAEYIISAEALDSAEVIAKFLELKRLLQ